MNAKLSVSQKEEQLVIVCNLEKHSNLQVVNYLQFQKDLFTKFILKETDTEGYV